eukprot:TRINITY_DN3152_c0_g1_i1.p1 TRINITY_DN3152_c0_g1~~TRINITY_DN3152_c0_g1_i1.p1  ORF type:complete len:148 (+),score=36.38 TRINITY_DN3152_c0_g1_i1:416-859(+)
MLARERLVYFFKTFDSDHTGLLGLTAIRKIVRYMLTNIKSEVTMVFHELQEAVRGCPPALLKWQQNEAVKVFDCSDADVERMAQEINAVLDVNEDGSIDEQEFVTQFAQCWGKEMEQLLQAELKRLHFSVDPEAKSHSKSQLLAVPI